MLFLLNIYIYILAVFNNEYVNVSNKLNHSDITESSDVTKRKGTELK